MINGGVSANPTFAELVSNSSQMQQFVQGQQHNSMPQSFSGPSQQSFNQQFGNMNNLANMNNINTSNVNINGGPIDQQRQQMLQSGSSSARYEEQYGNPMVQFNKNKIPTMRGQDRFRGVNQFNQNIPQSNNRVPYSTITNQPISHQISQPTGIQQGIGQTPNISGISGISNISGMGGVIPPQMQPSHQTQPSSIGAAPTTPNANFPKKRGFDVELYGMLGLLNTIRTDQYSLAMGYDLTTLGLNMNSSSIIYDQFAAPWTMEESKVTPELYFPNIYLDLKMKEDDKYFEKFNEETLFYIFYCMVRDKMQIKAAEELSKRNWFYHKIDKTWYSVLKGRETIHSNKGESWKQGKFRVFNFNSFKIEEIETELNFEHFYQQKPSSK